MNNKIQKYLTLAALILLSNCSGHMHSGNITGGACGEYTGRNHCACIGERKGSCAKPMSPDAKTQDPDNLAAKN